MKAPSNSIAIAAPRFPGLRLLAALLLLLLAQPAMARKVRVSDPAEADALIARGGQLIADYGAFRLIEIDDVTAPTSTKSAHVQDADQSDVIELNVERLNTKSARVGALRRAAGNFVGKKLHLVHFAGPVKPEWRAALEQRGARIVAYVPQNAYLIYGDAAALAQVQAWAASTNVVQWDGEYADDYKLHPDTRRVTRSPQPTSQSDLFAIQLVDDDAANTETLALIDRLKLEPVKNESRQLDYRNLLVRLPTAQLGEVAARPDVVSIQPYLVPQKRDERQNQIIAGNVTGTGPSGPGYLTWLGGRGFSQAQFTASGFAVDVTDSGVDNGTTTPGHFGLYVAGNPSLTSRVIYSRVEGTPSFGSSRQGCDGHGTLNSHIIAGFNDFAPGFPHTDAAGFHYGLGVCPFVKVGSSVIFDPDNYTFPNFPNLQSRAYQDGARISGNSWGAPVGGAYNSDSQAYDALVRDAQPTGSTFATPGNQQMVIVFAAGNSGPTGQTIGSPGTGKNVITVGASENVHSHSSTNGGNDPSGYDRCAVADWGADNLNDIAGFSSRGPCTDGRMKPDLVAPGTHITGGVGQGVLTTNGTGSAISCFAASVVCALPGAGGVGNPNNFFPLGQQFYTTSSGTSHSAPAVAGACALLRQHFINRALQPPSPALTKALLMNSTRYLTGSEANDNLWSPNQGLGELDLGIALNDTPRILRDQVTAEKFTASGQTRVFTGTITDPTKPFRITLAWTDAPGSTVGNAFNNDLDLTVTVGAQTYKGNVFSEAFSIPGGTADAKNNVETVFLPAGLSNAFTITVTAANINSDGVPNEAPALDQDFALVAYNAVGAPTNAAAGYSVIGEGCVPGNGVVDPGETVTVNFAVQNIGTGSTSNLVVTLLETNGVVSPSGAQNYGVLVPGVAATSRAFTFTASGPCGGSITPTFQVVDAGVAMGKISQPIVLGPTPVTTTSFTNATAVTIPTLGSASVYPSSITVSGVVGTVNRVTVTLRGLSHTNPGDIDALLVGPGGQKTYLMSDVGGSPDISALTLTFDESATTNLPNSTQISFGVCKPTNFDTSTDAFAAPAPSAPYVTNLTVFNGVNPNGVWSLYLRDDSANFGGALAQGWSLSITSSNLACCDSVGNLADVGVSGQMSPPALNVGSNVTFTLTVTNHGPHPTSLATLTDVLPAGLAFVSATTSQGVCTNVGSFVSCTLGPLTNGASAMITIVATAIAPGSLTNVASVSSVTTDPLPANNSTLAAVAVNAWPTISAVANAVTDEDVVPAAVEFIIGDAETPAGSLALQKYSSNTNLLPLANMVFGGSGSNRTVTLTPAPNAFGSALVTLSVTDGMATVSNTFSFLVNPINDPPTLAPLSDRQIFEGQLLHLTNAVVDVDSPLGQMSFALLVGPTNALVNPTNGVFTWLPSEAQGPGTNQITITVNDNGAPALSATQTFYVVVRETNQAPMFISPSNVFVVEGELLTVTNVATDADWPENLLTYSLDTNSAPAGAMFDPTNAVLTWSPGEADGPGTNYIAILVHDNGVPSLMATQWLTVVVLETNAAPTLAPISDFIVVEGATITFTNSSGDGDFPANPLTYSLETNTAPVGAMVGATNGVFSWTPDETQGPGTNVIYVIVSDGGSPSLTTTQSFTVVVLETNVAPVLTAIVDVVMFEGETLNFTNAASDADWPANVLTFTLEAGPTNATLDVHEGGFSWTPGELDGPGTNEFVIIVSDDGTPSLTATQHFRVVVLETNSPPALMPVPAVLLNRLVIEGETVGYTNSVSDEDWPTNQLVFSLSGAPVGAEIGPATGVFTWTPDETQGPSTNQIVMIVTDDGVPSLSVTQSFTVVVLEQNLAPVLAAIPDFIVFEGQTVTFTNLASDPDLPPNNLTFTLETAVTNALLHPTSGEFIWLASLPGTNGFSVIVTDDGSPTLSATQSFTVVVLATNHPPVLAAVSDRFIHAGSVLLVTNSASDPDMPANLLSFSLDSGAPSNSVIDAGSGVLSWPTSDADANSTNSFTVRVTDDGLPALSDAKTFVVTVVPRPIIESITVSNGIVALTWSALAGQSYRLQYIGDLAATNWTELPPDTTATGPTATQTHPLSPNAQRFYRITLLP